MSNLKTPAQCGELAEEAIGDYVRACGAFGDAESVVKALEMLISKAALGVVSVSDEDIAQKILLRSCLSAETFAERRRSRAQ